TQVAGGPSALKIDLPAGPFALAGPVIEPEPKKAFDQNFSLETRFFEGDATFTLSIRIASGTPARAHTVNIEVQFQACNERQCLPAQTIPLSVDTKVEAAK